MSLERDAVELAETMAKTVEEGADLGVTDAELCILALRAFAGRKKQRARNAALSICALVPIMSVVLATDFNNSGTSTISDLISLRNPFLFEQVQADSGNVQFDRVRGVAKKKS